MYYINVFWCFYILIVTEKRDSLIFFSITIQWGLGVFHEWNKRFWHIRGCSGLYWLFNAHKNNNIGNMFSLHTPWKDPVSFIRIMMSICCSGTSLSILEKSCHRKYTYNNNKMCVSIISWLSYSYLISFDIGFDSWNVN